MDIKKIEIENFVSENYLKMSAPDMAARFGCSGSTIKFIRKKLGLKVPLSIAKKWTAEKNCVKTSCSAQDDQYIMDNYLLKGSKKMASEINFSETKVLTRMRQLGLVVPDEVKRRRTLDNRFKPGSVPVTKGLKQTDYMTAEAIERTKASRYKKGVKPKNTLPAGTITTRTNHKDGSKKKWISMGINNWVPLHIHTWENVNGPVPPKHCIRFKDGNPLNCDIDNLTMFTKKASYRANFLAGKGLSTESRVKRDAVRKPSKTAEQKKSRWEDGIIRKFERHALKLSMEKSKENIRNQKALLKLSSKLQWDADKLEKIKNRGMIKLNARIEKWEAGLILKFTKSAARFATEKARKIDLTAKKLGFKQKWEDSIIKKFQQTAKQNLTRLARESKAVKSVQKKVSGKPKAVPKYQIASAEKERLFKIKRVLQKLEVKRQKERDRIERENVNILPTRKIDESNLIAVRIDAKTVVFVKPGSDPESVRNKFLSGKSTRSH